MPATKTKREAIEETIPEGISAAERAIADTTAMLAAAEEICVALARGNEPPPGYRRVFNALGWNNLKLESEISRCSRVLNWQAAAGTSADRQAALETAERAQAELVDKAPGIREQIATLDMELRNLERTSKQARGKVESQAKAVDELRKLVPEHVQEAVSRERSHVKKRLADRLNVMKGRILAIDGATALNPAEPTPSLSKRAMDQAKLHAQSVTGFRGLLVNGDLNLGKWHDYIRSLADERARLVEAIEPLQAEWDRDMAEAEQALDAYVR